MVLPPATGLSPSWAAHSNAFTGSHLSAFARRYLRSRCCFPFLRVLRCFSSPGSPRTPMHSACGTPKGGFPHSEIHRSLPGYRLPVAYRRFQRLSSPLDAKSSAVCPSWFDHTDHTPIRIAPPRHMPDRQRPPSSAEGQDNRPTPTRPGKGACSDRHRSDA